MDNPKPFSGYAFQSSRRYPRDPETVVIGESEVERARFVGTAIVDGYTCNVWRINTPGQRRYYIFQMRYGA